MAIFRFLGLLILYQVCVAAEGKDSRRPIWNIGNMVNGKSQIDEFLDLGANAIEFDIDFDEYGNAQYTFHGIPCDCMRNCGKYERIDDYLDYMRQLTTPGHPKFREKLVLLFMDFKVKDLTPCARTDAGFSVAQKMAQHYWQHGASAARAYVLLSISSMEHTQVIRGFYKGLRAAGLSEYINKVGVDVSGNEDLNWIECTLMDEDISERIWQGDGTSNCLSRDTSRLRDAIRLRDESEVSFIDKVYLWSIDKMSSMRDALRLGVDGVMTNFPDRLVSVLQEDEFSKKFRMATIDDNPWRKH